MFHTSHSVAIPPCRFDDTKPLRKPGRVADDLKLLHDEVCHVQLSIICISRKGKKMDNDATPIELIAAYPRAYT